MTTVTVVTGDPKSGRKLLGHALEMYIYQSSRQSKQTTDVLLVIGKEQALSFNGRATKVAPSPEKVNDLVLVADSDHFERWMIAWFKRYGDPLFHLHSKRLR